MRNQKVPSYRVYFALLSLSFIPLSMLASPLRSLLCLSFTNPFDTTGEQV
jgi:hypothetical protein